MIYQGFPKNIISLLLCPKDGTPLSKGEGGEFILRGEVKCESCGDIFSIDQGILRFDKLIVDKQMKQEMISRNLGAAKYDARLGPRFYREILPTLKALGEVQNKNILEYGAGTGRLTTEIVGAKVIAAVDFSFNSLQLLASKESGSPLALICADATQIKFKSQTFDLIVATQLIEHIPSQNLRRRFYELVQKHLLLGGRFVATVYHHDLRRRFYHEPVEGEHKNAIFYHYFTAPKLREEVAGIFTNYKINYLDLVWPILGRVRWSPKMEGLLSELGVKIPVIRNLSHLLLIRTK